MPGLTPRQARFVQEYLIDLNATQAAIRSGYSKHTAKQQGARLLTNADVCKAVAAKQAKVAEKTELSVAWVLGLLSKEAQHTGEGSTHSARVKAQELLGKHLGMFTEKIEHSGTVQLVVEEIVDG